MKTLFATMMVLFGSLSSPALAADACKCADCADCKACACEKCADCESCK